MDTKGRRLFKYAAGFMSAAVLMGAAYTTTAMAGGIGLIDTADLLDIHAEAGDASEVVGQVMDEGHVAILSRSGGWVQIKAGDIVGWVEDSYLIETEVSNEEAVEANQDVIEKLTEETEENKEDNIEENTEASEEEPENAQEEQNGREEASENQDTQPETEADNNSNPAEDETKAAQDGNTAEAVKTAEEVKAQQEDKVSQEAEAVRLAQEQIAAAAEAQKAAQAAVREQEEALLKQAEAQKQAILAAAGATEEDLHLMAAIIYCEAGGEPYVGKVAVGSVVMNRVHSDSQPDTIPDVIYAKGQFSPVRNGSLKRALANNSADESCYQAAMEAMTGVKPVGDKLYFRRVNGRSGQVIGRHVFY